MKSSDSSMCVKFTMYFCKYLLFTFIFLFARMFVHVLSKERVCICLLEEIVVELQLR